MGKYERIGAEYDTALKDICEQSNKITEEVGLADSFVPHYNGDYDHLALYVKAGLDHIKEEASRISTESGSLNSTCWQSRGKEIDQEIEEELAKQAEAELANQNAEGNNNE